MTRVNGSSDAEAGFIRRSIFKASSRPVRSAGLRGRSLGSSRSPRCGAKRLEATSGRLAAEHGACAP